MFGAISHAKDASRRSPLIKQSSSRKVKSDQNLEKIMKPARCYKRVCIHLDCEESVSHAIEAGMKAVHLDIKVVLGHARRKEFAPYSLHVCCQVC